MLLFLADIFFTVLYARAGTGLLAPQWSRLIWAVVSSASRLFSRHRSGHLVRQKFRPISRRDLRLGSIVMDHGTTEVFSCADIEILPSDHILQNEMAICVLLSPAAKRCHRRRWLRHL